MNTVTLLFVWASEAVQARHSSAHTVAGAHRALVIPAAAGGVAVMWLSGLGKHCRSQHALQSMPCRACKSNKGSNR